MFPHTPEKAVQPLKDSVADNCRFATSPSLAHRSAAPAARGRPLSQGPVKGLECVSPPACPLPARAKQSHGRFRRARARTAGTPPPLCSRSEPEGREPALGGAPASGRPARLHRGWVCPGRCQRGRSERASRAGRTGEPQRVVPCGRASTLGGGAPQGRHQGDGAGPSRAEAARRGGRAPGP